MSNNSHSTDFLNYFNFIVGYNFITTDITANAIFVSFILFEALRDLLRQFYQSFLHYKF